MDKDTAESGEELTYTLTVTNAGPSPANVEVSDTLPSQVEFIGALGCSMDGPKVSCETALAGCTLDDSKPNECSSQSTAAAQSFEIKVRVRNDATGLIQNTADCDIIRSTGDPPHGDPDGCGEEEGRTAETTVTSPDLSISKLDSPDPVLAGEELTYTLTVSNVGTSTASAIVVTDTLPAGVVFQSATGTGWACTETGDVVTCNRDSLAVATAPPRSRLLLPHLTRLQRSPITPR